MTWLGHKNNIILSDDAVSNVLLGGVVDCDNMVSLFHVNVQCLSNKIDQLSLFLNKFNFDILCLSEHWLTEHKLKLINIPGYSIGSSFCRSVSVHGGVAIFVKDKLKCKPLELTYFNDELNSEFCGIEVPVIKTLVITTYRSCVGDIGIFLTNLENLLSRYSADGKKIILVGDFNINFRLISPDLTDLTCLINSFGLFATISDFTRISKQSASCIDNILTNIPDECIKTGVLEPCLSDHLGQFILVNEIVNNDTPTVFRRVVNDTGLLSLRESLHEIDWSIFENSNDVILLSNFLVNTLQTLIRAQFPLKKCSTKPKEPIWFNTDLKNKRDILSTVKHVCNVTNNPKDIAIYHSLRKDYRSSIEIAKKFAYGSFIVSSTNTAKACWQLINAERNKGNSNRFDPGVTPGDFNTFFTTIADTIINTLPNLNINSYDKLEPNIISTKSCSFFLHPVTPEEVKDAIMCCKNSHSFDIYDINSKILKATYDIFLIPFTILINLIFTTGIFPDVFKHSKVIPLYKKGDPSLLDNFRPISIIPIFAKIIEIILKNRLTKYFVTNDLFNDSQFGFRQNRSTIDAVLRVVGDIVDGLERGMHTALTLCDLTKAFDCVSHSILLEKMSLYGIRGLPLCLFDSYLNNRRQSVCLHNLTSSTLNIKHGVPQGSVLGPFLFLIYINDLCNHLTTPSCVVFADDTTIICQNNDINNLHDESSRIANKAENWFTSNKLKLNPDKSQRLVFSTNRTLIRGSSANWLGIILDDSLSWSQHIDALRNKLSSATFVLRQLKSFNFDVLKNVYFSLFHTHLNYGVILWGSSPNAIKIFRQQKIAIRILANAKYRDHCRPFFLKFKIMTLPSLYIYSVLLEIHKKINNYSTQSEIHDYNTRSANLLRVPRFRLCKSTKNSLDLRLYNGIPENIKSLNILRFKKEIKKFLVKHCFYSVEDYLNTPFLSAC